MYKIETHCARDNCEDQKQKEITCNRTLLYIIIYKYINKAKFN